MTAAEAFDLYHVAVFRFVYRMTRCADTADDIAQECFLAFMRTPERYDQARGPVKTFLFSIARNLVLKEHRDRRVEAPLETDDFARGCEPALRFELSFAVENAVAALPSLQRETLILFVYEGFTLEEIGEIAGVDIGAVKSRLHRARERLKKTLAPYKPAGGVHETGSK